VAPAKGGGGSGVGRWMTPRAGSNCWAERLCRPVGQLGRCKVFGSGEEGGSGGLRWAKRPDELGAMVGFTMKN
jgi:hypothetical protein